MIFLLAVGILILAALLFLRPEKRRPSVPTDADSQEGHRRMASRPLGLASALDHRSDFSQSSLRHRLQELDEL